MISTRPWLGISSPDWFLYSDTPQTKGLPMINTLRFWVG